MVHDIGLCNRLWCNFQIMDMDMDHISNAISPADFILGTQVQFDKAHSMTRVMMTSKVNFKFLSNE